jgi:hypothetical protein
VATFAARGAEKLRRHGLAAGALHAWLDTHRFRSADPQAHLALTVPLATPSNDSAELIAVATAVLRRTWLDGNRWRKVGVLLLELAKAGTRQAGLLDAVDRSKSAALMAALDAVHRLHGRDSPAVRGRGAAEGMADAAGEPVVPVYDPVGRAAGGAGVTRVVDPCGPGRIAAFVSRQSSFTDGRPSWLGTKRAFGRLPRRRRWPSCEGWPRAGVGGTAAPRSDRPLPPAEPDARPRRPAGIGHHLVERTEHGPGIDDRVDRGDLEPGGGLHAGQPGLPELLRRQDGPRLEAMGQAKYRRLTGLNNGHRAFNGRINLDPAALDVPLRRRKLTT